MSDESSGDSSRSHERLVMPALIFVGGVHGAGKSTLCRRWSHRLNCDHLTASDLIKSRPTAGIPDQKAVTNVPLNQQRLIEAVRARAPYRRAILLDGHYCLRSSYGSIEAISIRVFQELSPAALVLVAGEAEVIHERLQERDHWSPGIPVIIEMLSAERSHADNVSVELGLPLFTIGAGDDEERISLEVQNAVAG